MDGYVFLDNPNNNNECHSPLWFIVFFHILTKIMMINWFIKGKIIVYRSRVDAKQPIIYDRSCSVPLSTYPWQVLSSAELLIRCLLKCKPADRSTITHLQASFINHYEIQPSLHRCALFSFMKITRVRPPPLLAVDTPEHGQSSPARICHIRVNHCCRSITCARMSSDLI